MHARQIGVGLAAGLTSLIALTSCGAEIDESPATRTVTVENCGVEQTYERPDAALAYDMSSIEKMFALGLADRMRGMVLPETAHEPAERSTYAEDYASVPNLSTDVLALETVVDAEADWVLAGWNSGFSEDRGITPSRLDELGIASYQHTESCFEYGTDPVKTEPLKALYTDLRDLGTIFGVEERAAAVIDDIRTRFDALAQRRPPGQGPKTFIYDSGTSAPFTSGNQGMPHVIVERAGAEHVFGDLEARWTEVGWESVAAKNPEVIAVVDYGDQPVAEKIEFLRQQPALQSTEAVRHDRFHVLDYGETVSGPRNIDAAEKFADYLEGQNL